MDRSGFDPVRRKATRLLAAGTMALPLARLLGNQKVYARENNGSARLSESDQAAEQLNYVHNANDADRADKFGVPGDEQTCANCQFLQGGEGEWRPCEIFSGKDVNVDGWCSGWAPTESAASGA
ncbi:MAG: high-potential iron-sulfur protein [Pseudomonadales bacterium]